MGIYSTYEPGYNPIRHDGQLWDPCATLGITNPVTGSFTCVGYAPSRGRRCQNPIAQHNRSCVYSTLESLAYRSPDSPLVLYELRRIAGLALCRAYHQGQVQSVVAGWQHKISSVPLTKARETSFGSENASSNHATSSSQSPYRTTQELLQECLKLAAQLKGQSDEKQRHRNRGSGDFKARREGKNVEKENFKGDQQRPRKQSAQEYEQATREAEARRQEEVRKQEELRRAEEARKENEARNERIRRQAQEVREQREREAREKAMKEAKEWTSAWDRYFTKWTTFKQLGAVSDSLDGRIPWPVKSGVREDANESAVELFFEKGPGAEMTPKARHKMIKDELLKWHPDRKSRVFPGMTLGEMDTTTIEMIAKVGTRLMEKYSAEA